MGAELTVLGMFATLVFFIGIRIIRPTHVGLIETLGKYSRTATPGFNWVIPVIQRMYYVNMTEQMVDTEPQTVITKDNLNAIVDAVVYYKVTDPKSSQYNVNDHRSQLVALARTTLRAVIGTMTFTDANENRNMINSQIETVLDKETINYGVNVLRVEIQKIEAPNEVQNAMNEVVIAERIRIASTEKANAAEIEADGKRRAAVQEAEGLKQAEILEAEGKARAIQLVNEAADKYFVGNAVALKQLEVSLDAIKDNSKIIIAKDGINPQLLIGNLPVTAQN